jgi:hypothetical protein
MGSFDDITADPSQPVYYKVSAVNSVNSAGGALSNEVNFPATPGIQLLSINSEKAHGSAGTFGINLPQDGSAIECRAVGALPGGATGDYQLVFHFANPVTTVSNTTLAGTGSIASASVQGGDYVVNLAGVTNVQRITVTLTGVTDSAGFTAASVSGTMGVLIGDVNASKRVDAADVSSVRQQTLQTVTSSNFRNDLNASGRIDAADVSIARQQTLTSLP